MLDKGLSEAAMSGDWQLIAAEALAVGAFVIAAFIMWDRTRIWERTRRIETQLGKMGRIIDLFEVQESKRIMIELKAKCGEKADQRDIPSDASVGDVTKSPVSRCTTDEQLENRKLAKLASRRRLLSCRKPSSQR